MNILVLDSRREPRDRMARLLMTAPGVARVGAAASSTDLVGKFRFLPADMVFLSVRMPSEVVVETIRKLSRTHHGTRVVVYGPPESGNLVAVAIKEGAVGFLACEASSLGCGRRPRSVPLPRTAAEQEFSLSKRELEVLRGMSLGKTNGEIGGDLQLSEDTVKTHAQRLFRKLSATDRAHAVVQGMRQNLID
ncbi:response regulator transcription factor [Amycolatopsis sp. NPDC052450]|uniref:response regulator transcription factor n=1 Tax=Amycolatopsis sp. NPDC052450 TaxID=3363937 RepID=UPI0037C91E1F